MLNRYDCILERIEKLDTPAIELTLMMVPPLPPLSLRMCSVTIPQA